MQRVDVSSSQVLEIFQQAFYKHLQVSPLTQEIQMKKAFVIAALLLSVPVFADDSSGAVDAGATAISITVSAPVVGVADAGVVDPSVPAVDVSNASSVVKAIFTGVKEGNLWLAAGALLVLVVSILRISGRKFHEWLPDNNILDKPLIFLYDTKIGGWVLNWLTTMAGGIGTALAAGVAVNMSLWKSVVMVSVSGTALNELYNDIKAWWAARKAAKAAAPAVATPVKPVDPPKP